MEKEIFTKWWFTHSEFIQTQCKIYFSISCLYSNTDVSTTKISWVPRDCLIISWKQFPNATWTSSIFSHLLNLLSFVHLIYTVSSYYHPAGTDQGLWCLRFIWLRRKLFKENCKLQIHIRWKCLLRRSLQNLSYINFSINPCIFPL